MAATTPAMFGDAPMDQQPELHDSDRDAEGEDDVDVYTPALSAPENIEGANNGDSMEVDETADTNAQQTDVATGETEVPDEPEPITRDQEYGDNDEEVEEYEQAQAISKAELSNHEENSDGEVDEDDASYQSEGSRSNGSPKKKEHLTDEEESDVFEDWEEESKDGDVEEIASTNNCIVCGQDEEHDPSEEFEICLGCAVCGDHCHRQCGRDQGYFSSDDDVENWRCPSCVQNKLNPDVAGTPRPRRSVPANITRDLLPAHAEAFGPDSHSIFQKLIIDEDPLDGSRSLRKRKSSDEGHRPVTRKRQKPASAKLERSESVGSNAQTGSGEAGVPADRSTRSRRTRTSQKPLCNVVQKQYGKLILALRPDKSRLGKILGSRRRPQPPRQRPSRPPPPPQVHEQPSQFALVNPTPYTAPFYTFHDRGNDELNSKPYGGILAEADADTSKTLPLHADREKFEAARKKAEEEWREKIAMSEQNGDTSRVSQKLSGPPSKIKCINFGGYEIETWYAAPYPEEYSRNKVLYICEFCLKYMSSDYVAWRHKLKCPAKHPPGDEIYRDGSISVFEVDGRKNPVYCQNMCLLAKLFLGSKTLYYDVEPFLFYVMTEFDELGCHFVGYFSKEKRPSTSNNVSCILTLPIHQRKGYGNLLIDFSYLLTRIERKTGSPEKPLSDMGLVSYRNYWRLILCYQLRDQTQPLSIAGISHRTGMTADDIVSGLEALRALVRDPVTKAYALRLNYEYFEEYIQKWEQKGYVRLNPNALVWTPYIMGRSNQTHYDRAPIHTVAPREDDGLKHVANGAPKVESEYNADSQTKVNGVSAVAANGKTQRPSASPSVVPPGPPSTSNFSLPDISSNHTAGSRNGSAAPSEPYLANGIPPTRFEIWPPLNGPAKRRPGRPFGTTKKRPQAMVVAATTATTTTTTTTAAPTIRATSTTAPSPVKTSRGTPRRTASLAAITPTPTARPGLRRGRSRLFETVDPEDESADASAAGKDNETSADVKMTGVDEEPSVNETENMNAAEAGSEAPVETSKSEQLDGTATESVNDVENTGSPMAIDVPDELNQVNGIAAAVNDSEQIETDQIIAADADSGPSASLKDIVTRQSTLNDPVAKLEPESAVDIQPATEEVNTDNQ